MKLTAEELNNLNQRTTDVGLFMYAEAYMACVGTLTKEKPTIPHVHSPIRFLLFHGVELYLKSFLRWSGINVADLASREYGHNFTKLINQATSRGLQLRVIDIERLKFSEEVDSVIQARYIVTGYKQLIPTQDLIDTALYLRSVVKEMVLNCGVRNREPAWTSSLLVDAQKLMI